MSPLNLPAVARSVSVFLGSFRSLSVLLGSFRHRAQLVADKGTGFSGCDTIGRNYLRAGEIEHIDVMRMGFNKADFLKMTPDERGSYLLLGYSSNQVNVLWKLVIAATNRQPTDPVDGRLPRTNPNPRSADHRNIVGDVAAC